MLALGAILASGAMMALGCTPLAMGARSSRYCAARANDNLGFFARRTVFPPRGMLGGVEIDGVVRAGALGSSHRVYFYAAVAFDLRGDYGCQFLGCAIHG